MAHTQETTRIAGMGSQAARQAAAVAPGGLMHAAGVLPGAARAQRRSLALVCRGSPSRGCPCSR